MGRPLQLLQLVAFLLLLVLTAWLSLDLINAVAAQPCPDGGSACYPWGAEGPAAGRWSYAGKENYLIRGFAQLGLLLGSGGFLIWRAGTDAGLTRIHHLGAALTGAAFLMLFLI